MIKIKQITKKGLEGILLFLPMTVVFATSNSLMRGLEVTKSFFLESIGLLYLVLLAFWIFRKSSKISIQYVDIGISVYWAYTFLLEVVNGVIPFYQNFKLLELTALVVIYALWRIKISKNYRILLTAILVLCSFQCVYGYLQQFEVVGSRNQVFKLVGSFLSPSILAAFLAAVFPIALGLALLPKNKIAKYKNSKLVRGLAYFTMINILILLLLTQIRAAWLAVLVSGSIMLWYYYKKRIIPLYTKVNKYLLAGLFLTAVVIGGYLLYQFKPDSAQGRILIWIVTKNAIVDQPIVGHGYDSFSQVYNNFQADYFQEGNYTTTELLNAGKVDYAYNELLSIWAEQGVIGLLLFVLILFYAFRIKSKKAEVIWAKSGLAGILTLAMVSYPFSMPVLMVLVFFNFAMIVSLSKPGKSITVNRMTVMAGYVLVMIAAFNLLPKEQTRIKAHKTWIRAYTDPNFPRQLDKYKTISPYLKSDGFFLLHFGQLLNHNKDYNLSNRVLTDASKTFADPNIYMTLGQNHLRLGKTQEAEHYYLKAIHMIPNLFKARNELAIMYDQIGASDKAFQTANEALKIPVKIESEEVKNLRSSLQAIKNKYEKR